MNKIFLTGNLGQDAQEKSFQDGTKYWVLNVATTEKWKNKEGEKQEKTTWHRCQLTGKYDNLIPYLKTGQQVGIFGQQRHESYNFQDQTTKTDVEFNGKPIKMSMSFVRIDNIELLGGAKSDNNQGQAAAASTAAPAAAAQPQAPAATPQNGSQPDDLPF